jgi:hypothetical protein
MKKNFFFKFYLIIFLFIKKGEKDYEKNYFQKNSQKFNNLLEINYLNNFNKKSLD